MADVENALKEFITKEFVKDGSELDSSTNLLEEEIIDSLGIFTLVSFVEDRFGVKIEPEEVSMDNFETLGTISGLVESKLT
ncbi:MAG: acyl carrier protein [Acidimicrobiia bacterium]